MRHSAARGAILLSTLLALGALPGLGPADGAPGQGWLRPGPEAAPAQEVREAASAQGIPEGRATTVVVRAVAHDAKVIGSGVGGARITIRDADTGEVLARGVQEGGTGSTERIMRSPHRRGETIYGTEDAASFRATLELDRPTRVEVVAEGPLGTPHATRRSSLTTLLLPGADVTGEGLIVELYGFTVELEKPEAEAATSPEEPISVRARVTMLCGCPITPGGLWDADRIDVTARLLRDGRVVREAALDYAGRTSTFEGRITPPEPGRFWLEVVASDAERANFGRARREVRVR